MSQYTSTGHKLRLMVVSAGAVTLADYVFDLRDDEPVLTWNPVKEDYAEPVKMENGKIKTFPQGARLYATLQFSVMFPSSVMALWKKMFDNYIAGGHLFFGITKNRMYEFYMTENTKRNYINGSWLYIGGVLDFIGVDLLTEIPEEF